VEISLAVFATKPVAASVGKSAPPSVVLGGSGYLYPDRQYVLECMAGREIPAEVSGAIFATAWASAILDYHQCPVMRSRKR
jgi:hypothetical protein